jgi:ribonuclease BN (tRNA processing enzyme)
MSDTVTTPGPLRHSCPDDAREWISKAGVRALNLAHVLRQPEGSTPAILKELDAIRFELDLAHDLLPIFGWKAEPCSRCGDSPAESVNGAPVLCIPCQRDDQIADGA